MISHKHPRALLEYVLERANAGDRSPPPRAEPPCPRHGMAEDGTCHQDAHMHFRPPAIKPPFYETSRYVILMTS